MDLLKSRLKKQKKKIEKNWEKNYTNILLWVMKAIATKKSNFFDI
jgi:hypothetical protein